MRPATVRLIFNALSSLASVYVGLVLYVFTSIEIEEHHDLLDQLEHRGEDFYRRFRQSAAALKQRRADTADGSDGDGEPEGPKCPLPPPDENRAVHISNEPTPYLLRTGRAKYLPAPKPADESCLRWKSNNGCWEHYQSSAMLCRFDDMALDVTKFHVSRGGERPEDVRGRNEEEELFQVDYCGVYLPYKPVFWTQWYQSKLMDAAAGVGGVPDRSQGQCDVYLPGLTLLYERIEYANLYHTMTDWFNVHWSLEKLKYGGGGGGQQLRMIWLDGHAAGSLDDAWADIFHANVTYVSQYKGIVCMERAVWLPKNSPIYDVPKDSVEYGYEGGGYGAGGFSSENDKCGVMDRFVERVLTAYDIPLDRTMDPALDLVIDRQPYFAHPRVDMEKAAKDTRTLPDLRDIFPNSRVIRLHEMSFRQQVELISRAHTLKGVHGAGLTHLLWLPRGAAVTEWQPSTEDFDGNPMFSNLASWVPGISHVAGPVPQKSKGFVERALDFLFGRSTGAATESIASPSSGYAFDRGDQNYYGRDMIRGDGGLNNFGSASGIPDDDYRA